MKTAVIINTVQGPIVVLDGKAHTLRALLGVDHMVELEGEEARTYLESILDKQTAGV